MLIASNKNGALAMQTNHQIYFSNSNDMDQIKSESVDLVVTSPPYPMIEMWDDQLAASNSKIKTEIESGNGQAAFELMHELFDPVWAELFRVTKSGGFVCLNIGDATRTINKNFALYSNHVRILDSLIRCGFTPLPCILWRKQTNAPNKFMGSGTLPSGAYVTLEHEYILILRKGKKRQFVEEKEKEIRRESAIFWEERNNWYSDVWMDVKGTVQGINDRDSRKRSAAFPFEIAHRLINMYSVQGDTVLDPFLGTGTTMIAAMANARNSIGYEIDRPLKTVIYNSMQDIVSISNKVISERILKHNEFVDNRLNEGKKFKYQNKFYSFPVVTSAEQHLRFRELESIDYCGGGKVQVKYSETINDCFKEGNNDETTCDPKIRSQKNKPRNRVKLRRPKQIQLSLI